MTIELDRLLRAYKVVGDITVRALSELDVRERERVALQASRVESDALMDKTSERYRAQVAEALKDIDEEGMRTAIVAFEVEKFRREAEREFHYDYIPFPDEATLEERHEVLRKRDESDAKINANRTKYMTDRMAGFEKKVEDWEGDVLHRELEARIVTNSALAKYAEVYMYETLVLACFKDGQRLFRGWEEVPKYSAKALNKLFEAYREVDNFDPWTLEKNCLTGSTTAG